MEIDVRDNKQRTPLHWAVLKGSNLTLEFILAHSQDLEAKDTCGHTALHIAVHQLAKENSFLFVKTLIIRGASPQTKTDNRETCQELIPEEIP